MVQVGDVDRACFVLLAPAINPEVRKVDAAYRGQLVDALTYERRTLEEVVAVLGHVTDATWVATFRERYLEPAR